MYHTIFIFLNERSISYESEPALQRKIMFAPFRYTLILSCFETYQKHYQLEIKPVKVKLKFNQSCNINLTKILIFYSRIEVRIISFINPEAAIQRYSQEKLFRKYAANLRENTQAKVRFQESSKAALLKSHFGTGVLL